MSHARWVPIVLFLLLVGVLVVTGLGRKRGARLYRLRMRLWTAALGLLAGGGLILGSAGCSRGQKGADADSTEPGLVVPEITEEISEETDVPPETQDLETALDEGTEPDASGGKPAGRKKNEAKKKTGPKKSRKNDGMIMCYFPAE